MFGYANACAALTSGLMRRSEVRVEPTEGVLRILRCSHDSQADCRRRTLT